MMNSEGGSTPIEIANVAVDDGGGKKQLSSSLEGDVTPDNVKLIALAHREIEQQ